MPAFAILLAGPVEPTERLRRMMRGRRVVAADRGMMHASPLSVLPELWIGDFDSATTADLTQFAHVEQERLSRDKDLTDGEAAIAAAIARGADDLLLVGALRGERTDHAVTNLALAFSLRAAGVLVRLGDGIEEAMPLTPTAQRVDLPAGTPFSILGFGDLTGLDVDGARWPLRNASIPFGSTLTQSNEALGPVDARCGEGRAILVAHLSSHRAPPFIHRIPIA